VYCGLKPLKIYNSPDRGATVVEAAITMPLFLLFLLFVIDIGRFFFIYIFLNFASHNAVNLAARFPVDADLSNCPSVTAQDQTTVCSEYERYFGLIQDTAIEGALKVASPSGSNGWVELVRFEHYYDTPQNSFGAGGLQADFAFLRPGEKVREQGTLREYQHPTRPFASAEGSAGGSIAGWPEAGESWSGVMRRHPLEVRIEVMFQPITPLLGRLRIAASQFAFGSSDAFDHGSSDDFAAPTPTPTSTPEATPIPTATPDPCEQCNSYNHDEPLTFDQCWDCAVNDCSCSQECSDLFLDQCPNDGDPLLCEQCVEGIPDLCAVPDNHCPDVCQHYCNESLNPINGDPTDFGNLGGPGGESTPADCVTCVNQGCSIGCNHDCFSEAQTRFIQCKNDAEPFQCEANCLHHLEGLPGDHCGLGCDDECDTLCGAGVNLEDCGLCAANCDGCVQACYDDCKTVNMDLINASQYPGIDEYRVCNICNDQYSACAEPCTLPDCSAHGVCNDDLSCSSQGHQSDFCLLCGACCPGQICGGVGFGV